MNFDGIMSPKVEHKTNFLAIYKHLCKLNIFVIVNIVISVKPRLSDIR